MDAISYNSDGILCWKGTCDMKIPNRYSHRVRSSHISQKIQKNPMEEVKR